MKKLFYSKTWLTFLTFFLSGIFYQDLIGQNHCLVNDTVEYYFNNLPEVLNSNNAKSLIVDPTFNPIDTGKGYGEGMQTDWFAGGEVNAVIRQPDGKLVYFGNFKNFNGNLPNILNTTIAVRLKVSDRDLPRDPGFNVRFQGGIVTKAIAHPNGILVAGTFTQVNGTPAPGLAMLSYIDGSPVPSVVFNAGSGISPAGSIKDIKILPDSSICLAGNFNSFNGNTNARYLCRLRSTGINGGPASGLLPSSVILTGSQSIQSVTFGSDILSGSGYFYLGGEFSNLGGISGLNNLARVVNNPSRAIDPLFRLDSLGSGTVNQVELTEGNSKLLVGGAFVVGNTGSLIKVSASSASRDLTFAPEFGSAGSAGTSSIQRFFVQGSSVFAAINNGSNVSVSQFELSSGALTTGFAQNISCNGNVNCLFYDDFSAPAKLVLGGSFTKINGVVCNRAGKIRTDNSEAEPVTKSTGADATVYTSGFDKHKKLYIGGLFSKYNDATAFGIARLTVDGGFDATFATGNGFRKGAVHALAFDSINPGSILAAGYFSTCNDSSAGSIVRLNAFGNTDHTFRQNIGSGANDTIFCIAVQPDGKILLGGRFTSFNGQSRNGIVRINGTDGNEDLSFTSGTGFDGPVRSILVDGSLIYVSGDFTSYNGNNRNGLVCLNLSGTYSPGNNAGSGIGSGGHINKLYKMPSTGGIFAAGYFSGFNEDYKYRNIVKMLPSGEPDSAWFQCPGDLVTDEILELIEDKTGRGGLLLSPKKSGDKVGKPTRGIIKLKPKGSKDLQFSSPSIDGPVFTIKRDPVTGKLIFVGNFNQLDSIGKTRVTRLLEEGPLSIWQGATNGWDWGAPDCGFSALIAAKYTSPGFTCKKLFVGSGIQMHPSTQVEVCQDAFSYSSNIKGMVYLLKDSINPDTVKLVEGYFDDLSLDNDSGATIIQPTILYGSLKLTSGSLKTNNQLTFKSSAGKTARLAKVENAASLNGQITMERFVGGGAASWHFLGTPIKKQAQSHWADDFLILPAFMYKHNEASIVQNGWVQTSDSMKIGKGFRVFLNQSFFNSQATFRNTGEPYIGNFNFSVAFTPGGYGGGGWNLLANPYPCEIDWHDLSSSATNMTKEIHYWTGTQYGSYNSVTQLGVNGAGRYVPSSQAFFVKAISASPIPSLSATEDSKPITAQNPGFYRSAVSVSEDVARIKLISGSEESDETAIRWMPEAQPYFENEYDNHKLENPGMNFFSLSSDGIRSSIQGRNFLQGDSVHLGYSLLQPGNYVLELKLGAAMFDGKSWKLRDNESGFSYPLTGNMLFPFYVEEGFLANPMRFTLMGQQSALGRHNTEFRREVFIFPNPGKDHFRLHGLPAEFIYRLEDASGRVLREGKSSGELNLEGIAPGMYFLALPNQQSPKERLKIILLP